MRSALRRTLAPHAGRPTHALRVGIYPVRSALRPLDMVCTHVAGNGLVAVEIKFGGSPWDAAQATAAGGVLATPNGM